MGTSELEASEMKALEILQSYRWLVREKEALEMQLRELDRPMRSLSHEGNAERAQVARERRVTACEQRLARMEEELSDTVAACEGVLSEVAPSRTRLVLRQYYVLGWTDEEIAEENGISGRLANHIRNSWLVQMGYRPRGSVRRKGGG